MQMRFTDQDFFPSFYERLGIEKTATAPEIARAYKKRAMETHPDRNPGDQENATKQFVAVGRAYEILKDPGYKAAYDRELGARPGQGAGAGYEREQSARSDQERRAGYDAYDPYKTDFTQADFFKDFTYTAEEFRHYNEASERILRGEARSGDLSTVFNKVAGNNPERKPEPPSLRFLP